jgi:hypothetical protein
MEYKYGKLSPEIIQRYVQSSVFTSRGKILDYKWGGRHPTVLPTSIFTGIWGQISRETQVEVEAE